MKVTPFADALRREIRKRGLTYGKAGRLLGCSGAYVHLLVNGERIPSFELLSRIAEAFGDPFYKWLYLAHPYLEERLTGKPSKAVSDQSASGIENEEPVVDILRVLDRLREIAPDRFEKAARNLAQSAELETAQAEGTIDKVKPDPDQMPPGLRELWRDRSLCRSVGITGAEIIACYTTHRLHHYHYEPTKDDWLQHILYLRDKIGRKPFVGSEEDSD